MIYVIAAEWSVEPDGEGDYYWRVSGGEIIENVTPENANGQCFADLWLNGDWEIILDTDGWIARNILEENGCAITRAAYIDANGGYGVFELDAHQSVLLRLEDCEVCENIMQKYPKKSG